MRRAAHYAVDAKGVRNRRAKFPALLIKKIKSGEQRIEDQHFPIGFFIRWSSDFYAYPVGFRLPRWLRTAGMDVFFPKRGWVEQAKII